MKRRVKHWIWLGILGSLLLGTAACGSSKTIEKETAVTAEEKQVIRVGSGVTPHLEILENVKERLSEEGYELEIKVFEDFVLPNKALAEGDLDVNLYQHEPYLINFNDEHKTDLVVAGETKFYFLPLGIYPGKVDSLDKLPEGAEVAIPNDLTNGGRALLLLQEAGLITLKEGVDITATVNDILDNPKQLKIVELEASQVVRSLADVDLAVINANFVLDAGLNVQEDALLTETADSKAAEKYASIVAVEASKQDDAAIQAFITALRSDETRNFINDTYQGAVIPVF